VSLEPWAWAANNQAVAHARRASAIRDVMN
jgi:hypothetical protein